MASAAELCPGRLHDLRGASPVGLASEADGLAASECPQSSQELKAYLQHFRREDVWQAVALQRKVTPKAPSSRRPEARARELKPISNPPQAAKGGPQCNPKSNLLKLFLRSDA